MKKWHYQEMSFRDWMRDNIEELRAFFMGKRLEVQQLITVLRELNLTFDLMKQFSMYETEFVLGGEECQMIIQFRLVSYYGDWPEASKIVIRSITCRVTDYIEPDGSRQQERELMRWDHREMDFRTWIARNIENLREELVGKRMAASELDFYMIGMNIGGGLSIQLQRHMDAFSFGMMDDLVSVRFRIVEYYESMPASSMLEISSVVGKRTRYMVRAEDFAE